MTLTIQVLLMVFAIVFSAGVAWGVVQSSIKKQNKEIDELKKTVKDLGECDKIVRRYLFREDDSMPVYVPSAACLKSHADTNKRLDNLNGKFDELLKELRQR